MPLMEVWRKKKIVFDEIDDFCRIKWLRLINLFRVCSRCSSALAWLQCMQQGLSYHSGTMWMGVWLVFYFSMFPISEDQKRLHLLLMHHSPVLNALECDKIGCQHGKSPKITMFPNDIALHNDTRGQRNVKSDPQLANALVDHLKP